MTAAAARGIRNAFRNAVRTISVVVILGLVTGLSYVMLIANHSVAGQVATTLSSIGTTVTISPSSFSASGQPAKNLTTAELAPIAHLHGVTSIDETLHSTAQPGGTAHNTTAGGPARTSLRPVGANPAVYLSGSTQPANPVNIGASTLKIVSGHAISGTSSAAAAMISTAMARANGLEAGSAFTAYGVTLTVAALFDSDNQSGNDTVITSLPVLQRLTGKTGQVSTAVVTVASLTDLAPATTAIQRTLGPVASVTSNLADASQAISDLDSVKAIALYSLAGATGAAVVILFLVMVMIVRERKREIGILKAIGASAARIMAQFTTEAATFTLLGLAVGIVAGTIAGSAVTSALVSHSGASTAAGGAGPPGASSPFLSHLTDISAQAGWAVILEALATAVVIAVLASAATTWMIGKIQPAEALRSE
jgi:putative ABC transport system permease protein